MLKRKPEKKRRVRNVEIGNEKWIEENDEKKEEKKKRSYVNKVDCKERKKGKEWKLRRKWDKR